MVIKCHHFGLVSRQWNLPLEDSAWLCQLFIGLVVLSSFFQGNRALAQKPKHNSEPKHYSPLAQREVRERTLKWLSPYMESDVQLKKDVDELWNDASENLSPRELHDRVIQSFSLADAETRRLINGCTFSAETASIPDPQLLLEGQANSHYASNLRLFLARYFTQRMMYDEALTLLEGAEIEAVVDPAAFLYFRAVCQHQLLMKKEALASLKSLLNDTDAVPARYARVAELMQHDLENLKDRSLGEIAHVMNDSTRRLALSRSGKKVQDVQQDIIDRLDELIKKLEDQKNNSSSSSSSGSQGQQGGSQSGNPAGDSSVKGSTAPGKVDPKKFKSKGGWGELPPKERTKARNIIDRQFPPHYRRQIEEYFKKLSRRRAKNPK